MKKIDLSGHKFGRLTVTKKNFHDIGKIFWLCLCDCGQSKFVSSLHLMSGNTKSCGCSRRHKHHLGNGIIGTTEHNTWKSMIQRCCNPKATGYKNYGGRGIIVCSRWLTSFENFYEDMGAKPKGLTLDRIDNNGNYEPSNCKWATRSDQRINSRPRNFEIINSN